MCVYYIVISHIVHTSYIILYHILYCMLYGICDFARRLICDTIIIWCCAILYMIYDMNHTVLLLCDNICYVHHHVLYRNAGAGIVADSEPSKEWDETALKFTPMLRAHRAVLSAED